jgi:hypothetical protein
MSEYQVTALRSVPDMNWPLLFTHKASHRYIVGELRPADRRRFVSRAAIAEASANAARIDAGQFRADLDAVVDPRAHD